MVRTTILITCLAALAACGGGDATLSGTASGPEQPNVLLIISDDQGVDASAQYPYSQDPPTTPTLDALAAQGVVYDNMWATPQCATTRACLISGKFGQENGVPRTPGFLDPSVGTIQAHLAADPATAHYACGLFGKWHLRSGSSDADHPATVGIGHYAGTLGVLDDYFDWPLVINGATLPETAYHTSRVTDLAMEWIDQQTTPWFAWVAYAAPHAPFHLPPASLHSDESLTGGADDIQARTRAYYLAMIEAMDTEIGRLLASLPPAQRANTVVFFVGDNGTPRGATDVAVFPRDHTKSTFYEGGLRVPLIVAGAGISRQGQRESALITATDFFATLADVTGASAPVPTSSSSFRATFTTSGSGVRTHAYAEELNDGVFHWAIRDARYKLLQGANGVQELYDLRVDLREENNLLPGDAAMQAIAAGLSQATQTIR